MPASDAAAIREETAADTAAVRRVNEQAFERADEADLVDRLRERGRDYLALVALDGGEVVGHIAFSRITMDPAQPALRALGLAPMAVLPAFQRRGIGKALVHAGLAACRERGIDAVFVLGHPDYYPQFGFVPAAPLGIDNAYGAPADAFMVLELTAGALDGVSGTAQYDPALAG